MPAFIAILMGGLIGWMLPRYGGAVFICACLGWLVQRALSQQATIAALKRQLEQLTTQRKADHAAAPIEKPVVDKPIEGREVVEARPIAPPPPAQVAWPVSMASTVRPDQPAPTPGPPPLRPTRPSEPILSLLPPALRRWLLGGNTIVKAGIAILFLGLVFLAKFASENLRVPPEFRLAGIGAVAVVLLVVGWRLRLKRPGYAQVLQGGAVAVLYLTLFVAFRSYRLLDVGAVFALMVAVAALAAALAVLQEAMVLAFIGAAGGFAVPLLVSTGSDNVLGLFSYYLVLDLGIAAIAWFRTWRPLNLLGFFCTFGVASAWGVLKYDDSHYVVGQSFLILYFLLFVAILLLPVRRAVAPTATASPAARITDSWVNGSLLFGLPIIAFALQYGMVRDQPQGVALAALGFAAFYCLLAVGMRRWLRLQLVFEGVLAIATVFLTLVIPFAFDASASASAGAWALEGAALVWLGFRQSRWLARAFGYLLLVLAGGALMRALVAFDWEQHWLNGALFSGVLLMAASLFAAWTVQQHAVNRIERHLSLPLIGWATLWWLATAFTHANTLLSDDVLLAAAVTIFAITAALYSGLARWLGWRNIALPVLAFTPVLVFALLSLLLLMAWSSRQGPLAHGGGIAWTLALCAHLISLRWAAVHWPRQGQHLAHALGLLCLAFWGALEGRVLTAGWGDGGRGADAWPWLGWLAVPAVLLLVLPRPGLMQRWPVVAYPDAYRRSAAAVLSLALLLWTLLANIVCNGAADPLPYVPLLNPLDIGVAAALIGVAFWLRSDAVRADVARVPGAVPGILGTAVFVWLNAMLLRVFHHYGDVPFVLDAWASSPAVQTGLTLLWSLIAWVLMWLAARRGWRVPWLVGAALLAVVVVKLLLVDLSGSGTVTRIISFIGAGVLMLVIGYVAPLPAAPKAGPQGRESPQVQSDGK